MKPDDDDAHHPGQPAPQPPAAQRPARAALPRLWPLAGPLFGEVMLTMAVGLIGTLLAARLGVASGAAFALATQVAAALFIVFRIVGAGVSVVVSHALGAGQRGEAARVARATLGASSWIGLGCAAVAGLGATPLLRLMGAPADVLPLATPLLQLLALAVLLDAWNTTLASVLRSHLLGRATLVVNGVMQLLHLALAWPLMLGWSGGQGALAWGEGRGGLGLPGFALALLASRLLGAALLLWLWRQQLGLQPRWADWWRLPRHTLAPVLQIGLPGAAENIAWRLGFMVSVAVVAQLGATAMATQAYTLQIMNVLLVSGLAIGLAAEMLVGRLVGAGQFKQADRLVRRALRHGLLISTASALAAALAGPALIGCFSTDPAVVRLGSRLLWLTVLLEAGRLFNLVMVNALRAAGDARYPVAAGAASFALVMAGGSWLLGLHLGLGLVGVWIAYAADEWLRGLLMWRRWRSLRWWPAARRMRRRLQLGAAQALGSQAALVPAGPQTPAQTPAQSPARAPA